MFFVIIKDSCILGGVDIPIKRNHDQTKKESKEQFARAGIEPTPSRRHPISELGHGNSYTLKGTSGSCSPPPSTLNISTFYKAAYTSESHSAL